MNTNENSTTQKLLDSIAKFKRIHWHQSPVEGLSHAEISVLFCIKKSVKPQGLGMKVSEISHHLKVASPTITQQINSLEIQGFVERTIDPKDRRAVRIKITEKGEDAIKKAWGVLYASMNGLVEYLGEEKSRELIDILSDVITYFNEKGNYNKKQI